jgi:hypothetical protein
MAKKLTYEFVKESFEREGYKLLSKEYINSNDKLKYKCPNGHVHFIRWGNWQQGQRCFYCFGKIKLTIDFVKSSFKNEGYILLDNKYINSTSKLNYICSKGHKSKITWSDWKQGKRCGFCANNIKPNIEKIKYSMKLEGYTLLSNEYINNHNKLKYICPNGHIHYVSWYNWYRSKSRCPYCSGHVVTFDKIKKSFEEENYTLLSSEYEGCYKKLEYICPNGHKNFTNWNSWVNNRRCPTCRDIKRFGESSPNWKGGISYEPYCPIWKDKEYKQDIRNRDGNRCSNPYCTSNKPNDLTIHHIDYDKKNCAPSNLITVCRSCNSKANTDRGWHKSWYKAILYRRYMIS